MGKNEYLGIDIGGTSTKYAKVNQFGAIWESGSFDTYREMKEEDFLRRIFDACDLAVSGGVKGIGLSTLGVINPKSGEYLGGVQNLPMLQNLNLKKLLKERFPKVSIAIQNDAKAAVLGELWVGEGKGCNSLICITLGTGIGGAIVVNGKLVQGYHNRAGEVGYSNYKSETDYYEADYSTEAVMTKISKHTGLPMDGHKFFEMCYKGDPYYLSELKLWMKGIARLIANLSLLLDPEKILIGGGISNEYELIMPMLTRFTNEMLPIEFRGQTKIAPAGNSHNAGILGAVAGLIMQK